MFESIFFGGQIAMVSPHVVVCELDDCVDLIPRSIVTDLLRGGAAEPNSARCCSPLESVTDRLGHALRECQAAPFKGREALHDDESIPPPPAFTVFARERSLLALRVLHCPTKPRLKCPRRVFLLDTSPPDFRVGKQAGRTVAKQVGAFINGLGACGHRRACNSNKIF